MNANRAYIVLACLLGLLLGIALDVLLFAPLKVNHSPRAASPTAAPNPAAAAAKSHLPAPAGKTRLIADEPDYDFGEVDGEGSIDHTFVLRNISDAPLRIAGARASCSCTVAELAKENLLPGEATELFATLDLSNLSGDVYRIIIVESDDREALSVELTLTGKVFPVEAPINRP